ncbi:M4 family metallopeptidase [Kitasatospora sp. NBC_01560]|uniref:M4 family metallopeptidase n=1 Tax=Kitasatospora sp. NBC_01560 TaxID=2975965 RepID=UPI003866B529
MHHRSRRPRVLGAGLAAVLSLGLAAPVALAAPAAEPDPVPGLVAGQDTSAPQLVTGLAEPAPGNPADAARAHLAAHQDRYRIDPGQLTELAAERGADGRHTVRFQQLHGGVPVLGAQYLVHLTGDGPGQRVESAGGKYFTGLTVPTTPTVPAAVLRGLALGEIADQRARAAATAEDHGPVVLPGGAGRLAQHFTVRAADPATGAPLVREVYVDALAGAVALALDARAPSPGPARTPAASPARTPAPAGASAAPAPAAPGATVAAAPVGVPATGTATDALGRPAVVNTARLADGTYQLTDLTRAATVTTYDAAGRDSYEFDGGMPADIVPVRSPGPAFPATTGTSGATDAHLNAGIVYDFYRDRLGREGLDGKAGPIVSVVNVTDGGRPFPNAFWDGSKMVYGDSGPKYRPFSVMLDVAGHEMTHGVVANTAKLVYLDQSGAMDEALADYFGNAIEVTARGVAMDDPRAALLGESKCLTGTPEACADRRMDDHRTTVDDYLGLAHSYDNGGVHYNSTIFSGALWDLRRTLDPLTADRLVYRALAEYLTPLDDFVDGRNAVLAAGRSMNLGRAELRAVAAAFDAHGIRAGWQNRIGLDSRPLLRDVAAPLAPVAADGHWVMSNTAGSTAKPGSGAKPGAGGTALFTGSTGSAGTPTRLSPEDGRLHSWAGTDGRSAAWVAVGNDAQGVWGMEVLTRPLAGGPVRSVYRTSSEQIGEAHVTGQDVVFRATAFATGRTTIRLSHDGAPPVEIPLPEGHSATGVTVSDGMVGWSEEWQAGGERAGAATAYSIAAGKVTARYPAGAVGATVESVVLAGGRLIWVEQPRDATRAASIRAGAPDGSGATDLVPAGSPYAPHGSTAVTASDRAVTYEVNGLRHGGEVSNANLPKLWQLPITGGTPQRLSCNRGGQSQAAADRGTRVIWLDASAGRTDLVMRDRPAGSC